MPGSTRWSTSPSTRPSSTSGLAQGKLYGRRFATDADRVAHLFALYAASAK
jgi:hypothetical protein